MLSYSNSNSSNPNVAASLRWVPAFFAGLLAVTCVLLVWHHFGMTRVVELSARSGHVYAASSDQVDGGATTVKIRRVGDALELDCQLVKKVEWPYCRVRFDIGSGGEGLNLAEFDSMSVDLDYTGPNKPMAKVMLVNFERGWSRADNWLTLKVNEIEAFPITPREPTVLPLDIFHTAHWWKKMANPPLHHSGMRIDNVVHADLLTAAEANTGRHVMTLRALRFHGKLITKNRLLTILISVWIASAMAWAGVLWLAMRRELSASQEQLKLLGEVNRALKLETEQLAGQAHHDPLTGVLNREGLRAELMSTSRLMTDPVSVVFLDIDHFKKINDGHGHETGDLVLRQFASIVSANVRASDRLVRWGGEEFLLLCPMSNVHQAAALAEKLRVALIDAGWPDGIALTSSFGVAQHRPNEEISHVIKRADEQLYQAKNSGRNRVNADYTVR